MAKRGLHNLINVCLNGVSSSQFYCSYDSAKSGICDEVDIQLYINF